jgi:hypothetical protein
MKTSATIACVPSITAIQTRSARHVFLQQESCRTLDKAGTSDNSECVEFNVSHMYGHISTSRAGPKTETWCIPSCAAFPVSAQHVTCNVKYQKETRRVA